MMLRNTVWGRKEYCVVADQRTSHLLAALRAFLPTVLPAIMKKGTLGSTNR